MKKMSVALRVVTLNLVVLTAAWPARGQAIDPAFRADIEKLMEVTGSGALGTQMATMASNQMIQALTRNQPAAPERAVAIIKEVLSGEFTRAFQMPDGIRDRMVGVYAKHFTHDDVRGLLTFYTTELGRKTIATMPVLARESVVVGQEWAKENMPRIVGVVQERLRSEGILKQ